MAADNGKRQKLADKGDEEISLIDEALVQSIEKLQEIQDELEKINGEAGDKVLEIEQKYSEIRRPVYDKRNEIIKTIPDFWLTAFLSHPVLSSFLNEEDQKIFKHLTSLEVEDFKDVKSGYSITFNFESNPYFEETKLTKTFTFLEGTTEVTATHITWKEGMGLTNGISHEKKGNKRAMSEDGPDSFFTWFCSVEQKEFDEFEDQVADIIKEDLWPSPLTYFNTEPDDEESDGDEADDDDKEGDDLEEDADEEDDDEEGEDDDTEN